MERSGHKTGHNTDKTTHLGKKLLALLLTLAMILSTAPAAFADVAEERTSKDGSYVYPKAIHIIIEANKPCRVYNSSVNSAADYNYGYDVKPAETQDKATVWDLLVEAVHEYYEDLQRDGEEIPFESWFDFTADPSLELKTVFGKSADHFKLALNDVPLEPAAFPTTALDELGSDRITMWFNDEAADYLYFNEEPAAWSESGMISARLMKGPKAGGSAKSEPAAGYAVFFEKYEWDDENDEEIATGETVSAVSEKDGWIYVSFPSEGNYRVRSVTKAGVPYINYPILDVSAEFIENVHRVTWHALDGYFSDREYEPEVYTRAVPDGSTLSYFSIKAPVPYDPGSVFAFYSTEVNDPDGNYRVDEEETVTSDLDLYAQYAPAYTITFDSDGGEFRIREYDPETEDYHIATYTTLNDKIRTTGIYEDSEYWDLSADELIPPDGKAFAGWSLKKGAADDKDDVESYDSPAQNVTLYARYARACRVILDANGGEFVTRKWSESAGDYIEASEPSLEYRVAEGKKLEGYPEPEAPSGTMMFAYYSTDPEGNERVDYLYDYTISTDMIFYAQFRPAYTLVFDANGGRWSDDGGTYTTNSFTVAGDEPFSAWVEDPRPPSGRDFLIGWATTPEGTADYTVFREFSETGVTRNQTFYARYGKNVKLTFDAGEGYFEEWNDASQSYSQRKTVTYDSEGIGLYSAYPEISNRSLVFSGWATDKAGKNRITDEAELRSLTKDTTLYAQYEAAWYAVFDANGGRFYSGDGSDPKIRVIKAAKSLPDEERHLYYETPEHDSGRLFSFWSTDKSDPNGIHALDAENFILSGNYTFYAQYTDAVTVTLDPNRSGAYFYSYGETRVTDPLRNRIAKGQRREAAVKWGDRAAFGNFPYPADNEAARVTFAYWSFDRAGKQRIDYSSWKPTANVTVYAQYAPAVVLTFVVGNQRMTVSVPAGETWNLWYWNYEKGEEITKGNYLVGWSLTNGGEPVDDYYKIPSDSAGITFYGVISDIPPVTEMTRIYGDNRFMTSLAIADKLKETMGVSKFPAIVLATGMNFPDALAGGYLAYVKDAPIILISEGAENRAKVVNYINTNLDPAGTIYVLGSEGAVKAAWLTPLKGSIRRLEGSDRYMTNIGILKEVGTKAGDDILVATGTNYADALSASGVPMPILLVSKVLKDPQIDYLNDLKGSKFHILGGEAAVSSEIQNALKAFGSVDRIAGDKRYTTSTKIAERFIDSPKGVALAYGLNFPDGLCGGALAIKLGCPLILANNPAASKEAAIDYANANRLTSGVVFGANALLTDATAKEICGGEPVIRNYKPY